MSESVYKPDPDEFKRAWRLSLLIGIGICASLAAYVFLGEMVIRTSDPPDTEQLGNIGVIRTVFYTVSFLAFVVIRFVTSLIRKGKFQVAGFHKFSPVSRRFLMAAILQYSIAGTPGVMGLLMVILTRSRWEMYPLTVISMIFFYANWQPYSLWVRMLENMELEDETE